MPAASSQVRPVRRLKESNRHLWPLYGEFAVLLIAAGVYVANYK